MLIEECGDFIAKTFPRYAIILTNGAISYWWDRENELEHLMLDAEALSRRVLVTRELDAFWKQLQQWKHFNDDHDFLGDYAEIEPE